VARMRIPMRECNDMRGSIAHGLRTASYLFVSSQRASANSLSASYWQRAYLGLSRPLEMCAFFESITSHTGL